MATYYAITGGGNWSSAATWNTASGQATGNAPNSPLNTDTCYLDQYSSNVTVDSPACVCKTLVCAGYTHTLTFGTGNTLNVAGNVDLPSGTGGATSGSGALLVSAASTMTSHGCSLSGDLQFSTTGVTATLADNWTVLGKLSLIGGASHTLNGNTLYINGISQTGAYGLTGTTNIHLTGGSWTTINNGAQNYTVSCPVYFDGNVTVSQLIEISGTLAYTSGTLTLTGCTFNIKGNTTITMQGKHLNHLSIGTNATITLSGDTYLDGDFTFAGYTTTINSATLYVAGSFNGGTGTTAVGFSGTGTIVLCGSGTIQTGSSGSVSIAVTINTSGTYTFTSGASFAKSGTFTYVTGTLVTTGNTLVINGNVTLNCGGMTFWAVTVGGNYTVTLQAALAVSGNFTQNGNTTFSGAYAVTIGGTYTVSGSYTTTLAAGLTCGTLTAAGNPTFAGAFDMACSTFRALAGQTWTLVANQTLAISGAMYAFSTDLSSIVIKSATSGTKTKINLSGATQQVIGVVLTDVDATPGNPVTNWWGGTLTRTANITNVTPTSTATASGRAMLAGSSFARS
jgi:fibronectin-binding autotransporter adhesin